MSNEKKVASRSLFGTSDLIKELQKNPAYSRTERCRYNRGYQRIVFAERVSVDIPRRASEIEAGIWYYRHEGSWMATSDPKGFIEGNLFESEGLTEDEQYGFLLLIAML